jgi:DNA gyrase/topoisomerase IV subunit B
MTIPEYKLLDDIEHVRQRPGMYVGSIVNIEKDDWIVNNETFTKSNITYNPAILKLFCEILDNSIDEHKRNPKKLTNIKITIDKTTGSISIWDNGGISVTKHAETNQYIPTMIFTNLRAGSNFNDEVDQSLIGTHGVGSTIVSILSTQFHIETADGSNKFSQLITNGLRHINKEKIAKSTAKYTNITFTPDYAYFGESGLSNDNYQKMVKRVYDCAGCNIGIKFEINGTKIRYKYFKDYALSYTNEIIFDENKDWTIGLVHSDTGFNQISFVNSIETIEGGTHINYVLNPVIVKLREYFVKKYKFDVKPNDIKQQLSVFINCNINRPKFNSQTKSFMISEPSTYKTDWTVSDKFIKEIIKSPIIKNIIEWAENKQALENMKKANAASKNIKTKKVLKHIPATSHIVEKKFLFITEGDSANGPFVSVRNAETQGALPLRGKVMNSFGRPAHEVLGNKEYSELMAVLGLELGKPPRGLTYGTIVIMTDQDVDGSSIRCGLINFFYNWPELFEQKRIKILNSPRYILRSKKQRHYFYDKLEFDNFKGSKEGYDVAYIKGLGTLRLEEYKDMIHDPYYETISIDDAALFSMMYGDDSKPRKLFMME